MHKSTYGIAVEFGDCDPAGIAFYPNFFRWYDASARHFFLSCGVPPWRELERDHGIVGTPALEVTSRYHSPVTYGDALVVTTWIDEWRGKSFVLRHEIRRGDTLCAEGREVRVFAVRREDDATRLRAVAMPEPFAARCRGA
jgi:4-hydroxybenzoyl-CoA thioesterase